jgi:hypothetical protein
MQAALPAAGNIPDQAQLEKSLAPGKRQIKRPAFAFLSINFHLAFKQPSICPPRYIWGSGVPQF